MAFNRISIVGAGSVGATCAYALILKNIGVEILLVDTNEKKSQGEMLDLQDTLTFSRVRGISSDTLQNARESDIIIITAGLAQKPGETRLDLCRKNKEIMKTIMQELQPLHKDTKIIVVTNPVDILTAFITKESGLPENHIIGTGTFLDTERLKNNIAKKLQVSNSSVHGFILGEHGNSQFPVWSHTHIAGEPIEKFLSENEKQEIALSTMKEAYTIIEGKGATYYGIGVCTAELCASILHNQQRIFPVSSWQKSLGVATSFPSLVGENGIEKVFSLTLSEEEQKNFDASVETLKTYISF